MKIHQVEQNTEEWFALKLGKFSASRFSDLFSAPSTAAYKKAIYRPAFEKKTGQSPDEYKNEWMERGHEYEPAAAMEYELRTGNEVEKVGFVELNEWVGCSPDRFVGKKGLLEIKCPAYNTHIDYLLSGKLPTVYKWQVYGQLWVTGREWCDFMSYYPGLVPLIVRVERDEEIIKELADKVNESIEKAKEVYKKLNAFK